VYEYKEAFRLPEKWFFGPNGPLGITVSR
jgi:hypothetical protein